MNNGQEKLNFYYNREARLAKASQRVRELYEVQPKKRFALFSSLTDTKPKAFMFISIIAMSSLIFFVTYLLPSSVQGKTELGGTLGENNININVMRYNNTCFVVLKKNTTASNSDEIVDISVTDGSSIIDKRSIVFSEAASEEFRWSIEDDNEQILTPKTLVFYLQSGTNQTNIYVDVE